MSRSAVKPAIRSSRAASVADDGALRDRFLYRLQILRAGMQEEMDVRIDQAQEAACDRPGRSPRHRWDA